MCLLIGPVGVGKTLLMKRFQALVSSDKTCFEDVPSTIPTVGTNLTTLVLNKRKEVTIRELGGSMAPIWPTYFSDCASLMFMIDSSNPSQVSSASILLLDALSSKALQNARVLILMNKIDSTVSLSADEIKAILRLDNIVYHARQQVTVIDVSVKTGQGLNKVVKWLQGSGGISQSET